MTKQQSNSDFHSLPAGAAEFIKLVIKKMGYHKKVRADVQAELIAHFEDQLKGCDTDDQRQLRTEQLIADFGDAKLLGTLLRRAKKRCRPLWRTIIARTCQAIVILFICLVLYIVWFLSGKPAITTDYVAELNRLVRPVADESQNAAPFYHKAAQSFKEIPDDISRLVRKKYHGATAEEKQLIEKWVTDNKEALDLLVAGTAKPYYWRTYRTGDDSTGQVMAVLLPNLGGLRGSAYALCWRAQLHAGRGQYKDAFADLKSCYRLGRHIKGTNKFIVGQLAGIGVEVRAVQTVRDILHHYQIDSSILATLQKDLEQIIADENFVLSLEGEKLLMYDEIQRGFTEDRLGGGHLHLQGLHRVSRLVGSTSDPIEFVLEEKGWAAPLHILFTHPNKQETKKTADRYYAFLEKIARRTPAKLRAENIDVEMQTIALTKGNILLEILAPSLNRVMQFAHRQKADVQATLTIIVLLRYNLEKGDYPTTLENLVAHGYLKTIPIDPYSDQPLVYKLTDEGFTLYSLGADFDDDGGVHSKWGEQGGDQVFWPMQKEKPSR